MKSDLFVKDIPNEPTNRSPILEVMRRFYGGDRGTGNLWCIARSLQVLRWWFSSSYLSRMRQDGLCESLLLDPRLDLENLCDMV
jgi:hypothetical protein